MDLEMTIEQGDNGWILTFVGHDCLDKTIICMKWSEVLAELNAYFGWYDISGKQTKIPNK